MLAEVTFLAVLVAVACAVPGVFLVLRRMALLSDAITHVLLLGIVLGYLLTHDLASPVLVLGAASTGVLTVLLVETLQRNRHVRADAAIGLVFPALFSLGVILVSRFAGQLHLDVDAVLLGELATAPFRRLTVLGIDLPQSTWVMLGVVALNVLAISLFFKELKLATFDPGLAFALGFAPGVLHYGLTTLVSITAVAAFDAVGSILVVAMMITPAATALVLTHRLGLMLLLAVGIGAASAVAGCALAVRWDVNFAGAITTAQGALFAAAFLATWLRRAVRSAPV